MLSDNSIDIEPDTRPLLRTSRSSALGQIIFCDGCCCGRVERGMPEFPKELIKTKWKALSLNESIQLTVSGCLGPCDLANVACILTADGRWTWLGELTEVSHYEALVDWAHACAQADQLLELPAPLADKIFERFE